MRIFFYFFLRLFKGTAEYTRIYDDERNLKLYLVESEVPRVKSYLGLRKARSEPESAVCVILFFFVRSINLPSSIRRF